MVTSIATLLQSLIQTSPDWRTQLMHQWPQAVGTLHTKIALEKICDEHTLLIGVYDVHWMHELYYLSGDLIDRINQHLQRQQIKTVRFILARKTHKQKIKRPAAQRMVQKKKMILRDLTRQQQQVLQKIDDVALRDALQKLMQLSVV